MTKLLTALLALTLAACAADDREAKKPDRGDRGHEDGEDVDAGVPAPDAMTEPELVPIGEAALQVAEVYCVFALECNGESQDDLDACAAKLADGLRGLWCGGACPEDQQFGSEPEDLQTCLDAIPEATCDDLLNVDGTPFAPCDRQHARHGW